MSEANSRVIIRTATESDLIEIVRLLADDPLGREREDFRVPLPACYQISFAEIVGQGGNELLVAVADAKEGVDQIVGCLQLTMIPGLSRQGMRRAQIESVRVSREFRGMGIGKVLVDAAIAKARAAQCGMVQLTSDSTRKDAQRFYERFGFIASHLGMKLPL